MTAMCTRRQSTDCYLSAPNYMAGYKCTFNSREFNVVDWVEVSGQGRI